MTSSSSLYGTVSTQNSSSGNSTSLYGEAGTPIPDASGNVVVRGTLTVNGCAILTNCNSFSFLPLNAETIGIGASATTIGIGSGSGITTINNQLATANYSFPVGDGLSGQVLVTDGAGVLSFAAASTVGKDYDISASSTSGGANFNLNSNLPTTDTIKFASGTGVTVSETSASEINFAIGQSVATSASPTFADLTLTGDLAVNGGDITTTSTTANLFRTNALTVNIGSAGDGTLANGGNINIGDSGQTYSTNFNSLISQNDNTTQSTTRLSNQTSTSPILIQSTTRRSMRGMITINDDVTGDVHSVEFLVVRKVSTNEAFITIYAEVFSSAPLATFSVVESGSLLSLYATKVSSNSTDIYVVRNSLGAVI